MVIKKSFKSIGLFLLILLLALPLAAYGQPVDEVQDASFASRCAKAEDLGYPPCADSPTECVTNEDGLNPFNCLYLQEPLGGRNGYDLFVQTCYDNRTGQTNPSAAGSENAAENPICKYELWYGEAITGKTTGPYQAILAYEEGKETEGPLGLLYNYLGLVYNFLSGLIIAFVILISVIGGIRMIMSGGDQNAFTEGRKMIVKALVGMALWFTASVILYTINPTFFAF